MKSLLISVSLCLLFMIPTLLMGQDPNVSGQEMVPKSIPGLNGADESTGTIKADYAQLIQDKESEVDKMVQMYKGAASSEQTRLKTEIESSLNQLFELKIQKKEMEIRDLEAEINDVERSLEFRKINKDKIVQNRLKQLLGED